VTRSLSITGGGDWANAGVAKLARMQGKVFFMECFPRILEETLAEAGLSAMPAELVCRRRPL
jgi:hypothetical protein